MHHSPIHVGSFVLNPIFSYSCNFSFDGEIMERSLMCVKRMVANHGAHKTINQKMGIYRNAKELSVFDIPIQERIILMKINSLEFKILSTCLILNMNYVFFISYLLL